MVINIFSKKFFEEAEKWKRKICECCEWYSTKITLIFPHFDQKIILVTESPYNYPRYRGDIGSKSKESVFRKALSDFIKKDFIGKLQKLPENVEVEIPANVFQFIYKTFFPIFSNRAVKEGVCLFLNNVYWTHVAKMPLKEFKGKKDKKERIILDKCFYHSFRREIFFITEKTRLRLIVVASSHALERMFSAKYTRCKGIQSNYLREQGRLLTVNDLVRALKLDKTPLPDLFERILDCKLAIFPNPSPQNACWKREFYSFDASSKILHDLLHKEVRSIVSL